MNVILYTLEGVFVENRKVANLCLVTQKLFANNSALRIPGPITIANSIPIFLDIPTMPASKMESWA